MWSSLVGGSAIDERKVEVTKNAKMKPPAPPMENDYEDEDEAPGLHGGPSSAAAAYSGFDSDDDQAF